MSSSMSLIGGMGGRGVHQAWERHHGHFIGERGKKARQTRARTMDLYQGRVEGDGGRAGFVGGHWAGVQRGTGTLDGASEAAALPCMRQHAPLYPTHAPPPPSPDMEPLLCAPSKVRAVTHLLHVVNVILQVPDCAPREGGGKILEGGEGEGVKGVTLQVPDCPHARAAGRSWRREMVKG